MDSFLSHLLYPQPPTVLAFPSTKMVSQGVPSSLAEGTLGRVNKLPSFLPRFDKIETYPENGLYATLSSVFEK